MLRGSSSAADRTSLSYARAQTGDPARPIFRYLKPEISRGGYVRRAEFSESELEPPAEKTFSKGDGRSVIWVFLYRITNLSDTRRPSWACLGKFTFAGWSLL